MSSALQAKRGRSLELADPGLITSWTGTAAARAIDRRTCRSCYPDDVVAPRVFISYSHESEDHRARVLELAQTLRRDGFDAWIDRFDPPPLKGWPDWMERQLKVAHPVKQVFP